MKLSKLVKNGANIFLFFTPIFGQIGYFRGMKVKIGAKKIKKWSKKIKKWNKQPIFPVLQDPVST
jgi:hypothetical protein